MRETMVPVFSVRAGHVSPVEEARLIVVDNDIVQLSFMVRARFFNSQEAACRGANLAQGGDMAAVFIGEAEFAATAYLTDRLQGAADVGLNGAEDAIDAEVLVGRERGPTGLGSAAGARATREEE